MMCGCDTCSSCTSPRAGVLLSLFQPHALNLHPWVLDGVFISDPLPGAIEVSQELPDLSPLAVVRGPHL